MTPEMIIEELRKTHGHPPLVVLNAAADLIEALLARLSKPKPHLLSRADWEHMESMRSERRLIAEIDALKKDNERIKEELKKADYMRQG